MVPPVDWTWLASSSWYSYGNPTGPVPFFSTASTSKLFPWDDPYGVYVLEANSAGSIQTALLWDYGMTGAPHPSRVYVRVYSTVSAEVPVFTGGWSLSNGLGSPVSGGISSGNRVYKLDYSGSEVLTPPLGVFSDAYCDWPFGTPTASFVYQAVVQAQPFIGVDDYYPSYFKAASGLREQHTRDADENLVISTALIWSDLHQRFTSYLPVEANQGTYGNPDYDWTLAGLTAILPGGTPPEYRGRIGTLEVEGPTGATTPAFAQSTIVQLHVPNLDSSLDAVLESRLEIRWHYPYEDWFNVNPPVSTTVVESVAEVHDPFYAYNNGSVETEWTRPPIVWSIAEGGVNLLSSLLGHPVYAFLASTLGVVLAELAPEPRSESANFDACWVPNWHSYWLDESGTFADDEPPPVPPGMQFEDFWGRYKMLPRMAMEYLDYLVQADAYDGSGYLGVTRRNVHRWNGKSWCGFYSLINSGGGDPNPGGS